MSKKKSFLIGGSKYHAVSTLGEGGSAVVWKVRRESDSEVFALKRIKKEPIENSRRNQRFEREIAYGSEIEHPNIIKVHEWCEDSKFYYYIMDFHPTTLRDVIAEEFDPGLLLRYALQLCEALEHIHADGIVHRDIKPENILVDPGARRLTLADFGIAHFKDSTVTSDNDLLANRNYLAPEQMIRGNALSVGAPADIFALGLVITEMFTKQNPRGRRHTPVRDRYPFLADLDPILDQMITQEESQRLRIRAVSGLIRVLQERVENTLQDAINEMRPDQIPEGSTPQEIDGILARAARDVLSAKFIFERTATKELKRYNFNFHCDISFDVSRELLHTCVQASIYSLCMKKFNYEASGPWSKADDGTVASPRKPALTKEFDSLLSEFPLPQWSPWAGLPRRSKHIFSFLKDYHCEELLKNVHSSILDRGGSGIRTNLESAPILWIAVHLREYLETDYLHLSRSIREDFHLEEHLTIAWDHTLPLDPSRGAVAKDLFSEPFDAESISEAIAKLESGWDVAVGELTGGEFAVFFRSRDEFLDFKRQALSLTERGTVLEADVADLLRPEAEFEDLVALSWGRDFDVAVTLAKVVGTRDRLDAPRNPQAKQ